MKVHAASSLLHQVFTQCNLSESPRITLLQHGNIKSCSHRSLGVVDDKLEMMSPDSHLAGEIGEESQFEGITYR